MKCAKLNLSLAKDCDDCNWSTAGCEIYNALGDLNALTQTQGAEIADLKAKLRALRRRSRGQRTKHDLQ